MPYVDRETRKRLDAGGRPRTAGELNYCITKLVDEYTGTKGQLSYGIINEVMGVLDCARHEFYRRIAAPYEDRKIMENGEVYRNRPTD